MFLSVSRSFILGNRIILQRFCSQNANKAAALTLPKESRIAENETLQANMPVLKIKKKSEIIAENFIKSIKSANDSLQVMSELFLANNKELVSPEAVLTALQQIFLFQKSDTDNIKSKELLQNPNFEHLCRKLRRFSPALDVADIIESLKIISYLGVPANSEISLVLLQLIQHQLNKLSLQQIMFLDYLFGRLHPSTGLHVAIKAALPTLLNIQLSRQLDTENIPETVDVLRFMTKPREFVFNEHKFKKILYPLGRKRSSLSSDEIKSVLWSLLMMPEFLPAYESLLEFCIKSVAKQTDLDCSVFISISKILILKIEQSPEFYQEEFFNQSAEIIVKQDAGLEKACDLQKQFKKISFINRDLLQYIADKLYEKLDKVKTLDEDILFTIAQAFSSAKFVPPYWNTEIVPEILKNELFAKSTLHTKWLQFTLQLIVLGYFDRRLVELVLSKGYLKKYFEQQNCDVSDYLKLLIIHQNVMDYNTKNPKNAFIISGQTQVDSAMRLFLEKQTYFPFRSFLEFQLGENCVLTRVATKNGHYMQQMVKWNRQTKEFVPLVQYQTADGGIVNFENIKCDDHEVLISVDCMIKGAYIQNEPTLKGPFSLRKPLLEQMGVKVVEIHHKNWANLRNTEQISHLMARIMEVADNNKTEFIET